MDYANTIGKDIEVKCTPNKKSYFIVSFETICEIKDGPILTSAHGFGSSVNDALKDLAKKISKKTIVFDAYCKNRLVYNCPKLDLISELYRENNEILCNKF